MLSTRSTATRPHTPICGDCGDDNKGEDHTEGEVPGPLSLRCCPYRPMPLRARYGRTGRWLRSCGHRPDGRRPRWYLVRGRPVRR